MTERAEHLARAEQIIEHIEARSMPDPVGIAAQAQHALAIATIETARAARVEALMQIMARPGVMAALDKEHVDAMIAEIREFIGTIHPREDTPA